MCQKDVSNSIKGLGNHFRRAHNLSLKKPSETKFVFAQENCCSHYALFASLCRHLRKHHTFHLPDNSDSMLYNNLNNPSTSSCTQTNGILGIAGFGTIENTNPLDGVNISTQPECEVSAELPSCLPVQRKALKQV